MGQLDITLAQARVIDSNLVDKMLKAAEKKLKRSKAKTKGKDVSELSWHVHWSEYISEEVDDYDTGTIDQQLAARLKNVSASLEAKMVGANVHEALSTPPPVIVSFIRKLIQDHIAECTRVANLTEEERNAEMEELLSALRGPGFMEIY